ncbi:17054_t:CDS:2 [Funneliformis geosporum]|nr:17054_t:CDS:2 [Funneliformis geosporum]
MSSDNDSKLKEKDAITQYNLALSYEKEKDFKKAFNWECYELGRGVKKDEIKAFEYYQRSAKQGYFGAKFLLGYCHINGIGTKINKEKGFKLYDEAAARKDGDAENVGISDLDKVNCWYHEAANDDNKVALYHLGEFYELGKGVDKNLTRALEFYKASANKGYLDAQYKMGYFYDHGIVVDVDKVMASDLYQITADEGNSDAQIALAHKYEQGDGVELNINNAIYWYMRALDNGRQEVKPNHKEVNDVISQDFYELGVGIFHKRKIARLIKIWEETIVEAELDALLILGAGSFG